jgi:hypothetical protein
MQKQDLAAQVGRLIYIEAASNDGSNGKMPVVNTLQIFDTTVIPGATVLFVQGKVSSVDDSVGRITIGSLEIDVNTATGPSAALGQMISVAGTQPVPQGLILGTARQ